MAHPTLQATSCRLGAGSPTSSPDAVRRTPRPRRCLMNHLEPAILACVQAMSSSTQVSSEVIARDFSALFAHVLSDSDLMQALNEVELSMSQFKTLAMLSRNDVELSLKEVAEAMGLSLPAASRAVDGLCQRRYVERREDEVDRRMKRVRISPAGADVIERVTAVRVAVIARFLEGLPEADRDRLADAIAPLLARVA